MISLKQFFGLGKLQFSMESAYRFDSLIWITITPMFFITEFFLWRAIFNASGAEVIKGFTFSAMMSYYLLSHITTAITATIIDRKTAHLVKHGKLIKYLVRPIRYFSMSFVNNIWYGLFRTKYLPMLLILAYFLIPKFEFTLHNVALYIIALALAVMLRFTYTFLIGLTSFWMKEYFGIRVFKHGIYALMSGMLIPLAFFPVIVQKVFNYFPFQYMLFVPIKIFLGQYTNAEVLLMLGIQIIWIVFFLVFIKLVWKKALTRFMGVGV